MNQYVLSTTTKADLYSAYIHGKTPSEAAKALGLSMLTVIRQYLQFDMGNT